MQETQEACLQSLGQEDPLEEEMATHSSILPWKIPWTEEPGGLHSLGLQSIGHSSELSNTHIHTHTKAGPITLWNSSPSYHGDFLFYS